MSPRPAGEEWALGLFRRSVPKQRKWRALASLLPAGLAGLACLDLGADNGVMSLLLRRRGGRWSSADLDPRAVASIKGLVGEGVFRTDGQRLPLATASLDLVVVVDLLEHVADDRALAAELARVLRPGGGLIVNVPHLLPRAFWNRLRPRLGLTDERHGHLRPGYDLAGLAALLAPRFRVERSLTYARFFSETIDTLFSLLYLRLAKPGPEGKGSAKGAVVTAGDLGRRRKEFLLLSAIYPFLWAFSRLDALLPGVPGYKLAVAARRLPGDPGGPSPTA